MGLFDKIKTTAQSAVNSVTGNPATPQPVQSAPQPVPQQAPQPVQPQQQFEQGMVPQVLSSDVIVLRKMFFRTWFTGLNLPKNLLERLVSA